MSKVFVKCTNCGLIFKKSQSQISHTNNNYCSLNCCQKGKTKFNTVNLFCEQCGIEYVRKKSVAIGSKYCSKECLAKSKKKPPLFCKDCGKVLSRQRGERCKTCFEKSNSGENNANWKGGDILFNCDYCHDEVIQSRANYGFDCEHHFCNKLCESNWRSENYKGDKCYNWKGGITELRNSIRTSRKYRMWRKGCFEREDYTCELCNNRGGYLEVHHIKPFYLILKENNIQSLEDAQSCNDLWNENNGQVLCKKCHNQITFKKGEN